MALSPVRALLNIGSNIPRPKFGGTRRHTVGVNSANLAVTTSSSSGYVPRRFSTQSLNKSVQSAHSLGGSKHSLVSGGSQASQQSAAIAAVKQRQKQSTTSRFSSTSDSGDEREDEEQFFVPSKMTSASNYKQQRMSDGEYDADPSA